MLYDLQMIVVRAHRKLLILLLLVVSGSLMAVDQPLTFLVLADTVEPLMVTSDNDPMAGGIVTDVVREIFKDSRQIVLPLVVPWQRMKVEMRSRDDWIMYGSPSQCRPEADCAISLQQIVSFEHVLVTLADVEPKPSGVEDLFGKRLLLVENFHYPGLDRYLSTPMDINGSGEIQDIRAFTPASALKMLRHQRGDAYVDWRLRVLYNLPEAGLNVDQVHLADFSKIMPTQGIHLLYSSKIPAETALTINTRLAAIIENGTLSRIVQAYISPQ
jgi:hypothetical protein